MILGIHVERDRSAGTISISQRAYLERVLKHFGMSDSNTKPTPLPLGIILTKDQSPKSQEDRIFMADKPYREVLGSIMYAQIGTRPDLSGVGMCKAWLGLKAPALAWLEAAPAF